MANDGKLVNLNKFGLMVGVIGKHYARVIIEGEATSKLTINLKDLVANFASYFQPIMKINVDYYLKVKSSISNNEGTFYHDMNGYLVSLRKLGYRPDYRINDGLADKLNGNTYPACSFIYVKDGIGRKVCLLIFSLLHLLTELKELHFMKEHYCLIWIDLQVMMAKVLQKVILKSN